MYNQIPLLLLSLFFFSSCKTEKDNNVKPKPPIVIEEPQLNFPFPSHATYKAHLKPSASTEELNKSTADFYDEWKKKYLVRGCGTSEYKVDYKNGETVSEAHGYGMMITVYMAGYDKNSKKYFDGLFKYFKSHASGINTKLMSWKQNSSCANVDGNGSATDGDIDIAYALLLADKQWGSKSGIDYKNEAVNLINAIATSEINKYRYNVTYGDWVKSSDSKFYNSTRSSDFITGHFKSFGEVADNNFWNSVVNKCYRITSDIQKNYSSKTGLMPDFMVNTNGNVKPAPSGHLEGPNDGAYYYNACRFPWRIGTDYLISGDSRAKTALSKINNWLVSSTVNDPTKIVDGYKLDGSKIASWSDAAFVAPFAVSAMVGNDQKWMDDIYNYTESMDINDGEYYENSIKMLCMLVLSENFWTP